MHIFLSNFNGFHMRSVHLCQKVSVFALYMCILGIVSVILILFLFSGSTGALYWNHLWCCGAVVTGGEASPTTASKNHTGLVDVEHICQFPAEQSNLFIQKTNRIRQRFGLTTVLQLGCHGNAHCTQICECKCVSVCFSINSHVSPH